VSCAVFGALFNAAFAWLSGSLATAAVFRFGVGLSLAGVYPMGMKLVVSWAPQRTGTALALLVGMLTLGTALPHALKGLGAGLPWQQTIVASSVLALVGAIIIFRLGDGPHLRRISSSSAAKGATAAKPHRRTPHVLHAFRSELFRATALGYWGHMWELYTFWTLVPLLVVQTLQGLGPAFQTGSLPAFCIIAAGALGCVLGGRLSRRFGSNRVAAVALALSAGCCVVFASGYDSLPAWALFGLLLLWGAAVVADSPQFSALAAAYCPRDAVGSALAIMNSLGYAITIMSIALTSWLIQQYGLDALWVLVPGPVLGLLGFARVWARNCAA
jgi:MFS family permease